MEPVMYKNRLQEFTQKTGVRLPVYQTVNEGTSHAPRFRSTVYVNDSSYRSLSTFSNRKEAEQYVAKVALESIPQKSKDESFPFLSKDTSLCKSIMNEYAVKMKLDKPIYATKQAQGSVPVFVSEISMNGVNYTGQRAKTKKEAEQLAARGAILSILDSESKMAISEIIKSKEKFYALLYGDNVNQSGVADNVSDNGVNHSGIEISRGKRKEVDASKAMTTINSLNVGSNAIAQPYHEFKKPKSESSLEDVPYPIKFVPHGSIQSLEFVPCSSSAKNKSCKKKKSQKVVEGDTQTTDSVMPLVEALQCEAPPYPLAQ